jgi:hypothetical protein
MGWRELHGWARRGSSQVLPAKDVLTVPGFSPGCGDGFPQPVRSGAGDKSVGIRTQRDAAHRAALTPGRGGRSCRCRGGSPARGTTSGTWPRHSRPRDCLVLLVTTARGAHRQHCDAPATHLDSSDHHLLNPRCRLVDDRRRRRRGHPIPAFGNKPSVGTTGPSRRRPAPEPPSQSA